MSSVYEKSARSTIAENALRMGFAAAASACALVLANFAWSADRGPAPLTAVVSYADLNLNDKPGAQVLYRRLQSASRNVCRPLDTGRLSESIGWRACVNEAMTHAIDQIDAPALTAYHVAQTGKVETVKMAKSADSP
ncbi:MAG TPA: UrcA family protein [Steroidobacter sp.]|nr:UrcA family protein [Steroidobacter sp.]